MQRLAICGIVLAVVLVTGLFSANPAAAEPKRDRPNPNPSIVGKVTEYTAGSSITVQYMLEGKPRTFTFTITNRTRVTGTPAVGSTVAIQMGEVRKNAIGIAVTPDK